MGFLVMGRDLCGTIRTKKYRLCQTGEDEKGIRPAALVSSN